MIKRNINVVACLCNGSIGELVGVIRNKGKVNQLKIKVEDTEHIMEKVKSQFFINGSSNSNISVHRNQFPITLAYAITVHKSQGITLQRAIVDCGNKSFAKGMIYVCCTE